MLGLFRKKADQKKKTLYDLNGLELAHGDWVNAQRYDLGRSKLIEKEGTYLYQSEKDAKEVSYTKMVDAITGNQKVIKE